MRRNLLFLLIDGPRADLCYGEQGTPFNQAIAIGTGAVLRLACILTGHYLIGHGWSPAARFSARPG